MEKLQELFSQYYNKTATEEQRSELMQLIKGATNDQLSALIKSNGENLKIQDYSLSPDKVEEILRGILTQAPSLETSSLKETVVRRMFPWSRIAAAASVILVIGIGAYFVFLNKTKNDIQQTIKKQTDDVNPGTFKAKLTLADGRTIILDSAMIGVLAKQGSTSVINKDGQLVYESGINSQESVVYNTVSTNKGETYSMMLADGSTLWLNSASTVRFPVAFPGKERRIEITGEAYFKVTKNPSQKFIVSVLRDAQDDRMEVQALGTEFNINAYSDETSVSTTLIEGSVKVTKDNSSVILQPRQQSHLTNDQLTKIQAVNIEEVIGWKEGLFHFESADLKTILRQFSRWYDVEVVYEGEVSKDKYFGIMKRSSTLSSVLKALQANEIKFRIEGKKLIVQPG